MLEKYQLFIAISLKIHAEMMIQSGGGGGATHRSWVVKSGAVASRYGRRPPCLLNPNRVGSGSGWSSFWQHRPWPPYPRSKLAQARRLRPSSSQNASLVREAAQTQFNTWGRLALPLNGPTAIPPHLLREGLSKDRGKCGSRAGDWVLSPNGPLGKAQCPGYHCARFPEDHSSQNDCG